MKKSMTVKELVEILSHYEDDAEVEIFAMNGEANLDVDFDRIMHDECGW